MHPLAFDAYPTYVSLLTLLDLWRCGKTACPLNPRLPQQGRQALLARVGKVPNRIATLLCTSGTTGVPKIAAHSLDNYTASASAAAKALGLGPGDSWHLSLPLYHVSGLSIIFRCLVSGATLDMEQDPLNSKATHYSLVPTQLFRILQDPALIAHYRKARCLLIGGAPLSSALEMQAREAGLPIHTSWGMTETTAMATLDGKPLPHIEISLAADGEILVRGPSLFQGYLDDGKISIPLDSEGWFHTKDLGAFDKGRLVWKGRKDNLFISGGENIQPEEIETALGQLPEILEAIVVPVDDQEFGARPAAFIRAVSFIDYEKLKSDLALYLPRFKIPRWFFPLPNEEGTKPNRQKLRHLAQASLLSR